MNSVSSSSPSHREEQHEHHHEHRHPQHPHQHHHPQHSPPTAHPLSHPLSHPLEQHCGDEYDNRLPGREQMDQTEQMDQMEQTDQSLQPLDDSDEFECSIHSEHSDNSDNPERDDNSEHYSDHSSQSHHSEQDEEEEEEGRRRQLREMLAHSDDCWEADLSDDETHLALQSSQLTLSKLTQHGGQLSKSAKSMPFLNPMSESKRQPHPMRRSVDGSDGIDCNDCNSYNDYNDYNELAEQNKRNERSGRISQNHNQHQREEGSEGYRGSGGNNTRLLFEDSNTFSASDSFLTTFPTSSGERPSKDAGQDLQNIRNSHNHSQNEQNEHNEQNKQVSHENSHKAPSNSASNSTNPQKLSLPELLLQKRLLRKQRLQHLHQMQQQQQQQHQHQQHQQRQQHQQHQQMQQQQRHAQQQNQYSRQQQLSRQRYQQQIQQQTQKQTQTQQEQQRERIQRQQRELYRQHRQQQHGGDRSSSPLFSDDEHEQDEHDEHDEHHNSNHTNNPIQSNDPHQPTDEEDIYFHRRPHLEDDNTSIAAGHLDSGKYSRYSNSSNHPLHSHSPHPPHHSLPSHNNHPPHPLSSLPSRPLTPLPEEDDRKRIIGCLAAILASSYPHETVPQLLLPLRHAEKENIGRSGRGKGRGSRRGDRRERGDRVDRGSPRTSGRERSSEFREKDPRSERSWNRLDNAGETCCVKDRIRQGSRRSNGSDSGVSGVSGVSGSSGVSGASGVSEGSSTISNSYEGNEGTFGSLADSPRSKNDSGETARNTANTGKTSSTGRADGIDGMSTEKADVDPLWNVGPTHGRNDPNDHNDHNDPHGRGHGRHEGKDQLSLQSQHGQRSQRSLHSQQSQYSQHSQQGFQSPTLTRAASFHGPTPNNPNNPNPTTNSTNSTNFTRKPAKPAKPGLGPGPHLQKATSFHFSNFNSKSTPNSTSKSTPKHALKKSASMNLTKSSKSSPFPSFSKPNAKSTNSIKSTTKPKPPNRSKSSKSSKSKTSLAMELAEIRHRIRRHAVLSELLLSSAEMLLLDASVAKAFLPLLEGLSEEPKELEELEELDEELDEDDEGEELEYEYAYERYDDGQVEMDYERNANGSFGSFNGAAAHPSYPSSPPSSHAGSSNCPTAGSSFTASHTANSTPSFLRNFKMSDILSPIANDNNDSNDDSDDKAPHTPHTPHTPMAPHPPHTPMAPPPAAPPPPPPSTGDDFTNHHKNYISSSPHSDYSNSNNFHSYKNDKDNSHDYHEEDNYHNPEDQDDPNYPPLQTIPTPTPHLSPFLQTLSPGAGFKCLALLLLNHLLRDGRGYDARVRQAFKRLGVVVIAHEIWSGGILVDEDAVDDVEDVEEEVEEGEIEEMEDLLFGNAGNGSGGGGSGGSEGGKASTNKHSTIGEGAQASQATPGGQASQASQAPQNSIGALLCDWSESTQFQNTRNKYRDSDLLARLATRKFEAMEHAIAAKLIAMSTGEVREVREVREVKGVKEVKEVRGHKLQRQQSSQQSSQQRQHRQPNPKQSQQSTKSTKSTQSTKSTKSESSGRIALAESTQAMVSEGGGGGISKEQWLRGIKIGTAGAVGATLFALTGGLAAPGIAAGLAAVAGGSAVAAGVSTVLSSAAAISTIFGVGGAGLAGYKMHRRTKGLTEFDFQKEGLGRCSKRNHGRKKKSSEDTDAELFSTICISGWLRDSRDFQRPWGVAPTHPRITDKLELLERFYFVHNPENVGRCAEILRHWRGRYFQLWKALRDKYGRDPSNLFPLEEGPRITAELTHEEEEMVDLILEELGFTDVNSGGSNNGSCTNNNTERGENLTSRFFGWNTNSNGSHRSGSATDKGGREKSERSSVQSAQKHLKDSTLKSKRGLFQSLGMSGPPDVSSISTNLNLFSEDAEANGKRRQERDSSNAAYSTNSSTFRRNGSNNTSSPESKSSSNNNPLSSSSVSSPSSSFMDPTTKPPPKHLLTVWDYHAHYGGELYTVRWESELLMELCDSVTDQMIEWGIGATKTILHTTALATLMTAITLPYSLVLAANVIDNSWAMAMERADKAGVELAKSLIDSAAGHRPVTLVGFSMGARVIYSCLKELAKHQEIWEDEQQKRQMRGHGSHASSGNGGAVTDVTSASRRGGNKDDDKLSYIREPASIIEDAILLGTPNHVSLPSWTSIRRITAGRLINCYSRKDLILSLMFQLKRFQGILRPVCGTSPVAVNGVENYDVTDLVSSHTDYCLVLGEILKRVGHGEPRRREGGRNGGRNGKEVAAVVTQICVANKDVGGLASLADERYVQR